MDNISLLLLLEVARWFSLSSTTQMYYSQATMTFWRVLYKLYHGGCLRFMAGEKSSGEYLFGTSEPGTIHPSTSKINFAVPTVTQIRSMQSPAMLPTHLKSGADVHHQLTDKKGKQSLT